MNSWHEVRRHPVARAAIACAVVALLPIVGADDAQAQWSVDAAIERFDWREHTAPIEVHETGPQFALGAEFVLPRASGFLFEYHGRLYGGSVDYNGSFQFDATQAVSGASAYLGTTQGAELRYRWPGAVDAYVGLDLDVWRRKLSATQQETYRIGSALLGAERLATATSPFVAGAGMRLLLATGESATIEDAGFRYDLSLVPGFGASPVLHAGYRVRPQVTLLAYWDGMRLGRSNRITLIKRGRPVAVVSQPATDLSRIGLRVVYGW